MRRDPVPIATLALCGLILAAPAGAQDAVPGPPLTVDEYVTQVLERNPSLSSMASAIEAAEQRVPQAGALPDPMVGLSLMSLPLDTFAFDQEPMTQKQLTLSQAFPAPGVRGARATVAEAGVETSRQMLEGGTQEAGPPDLAGSLLPGRAHPGGEGEPGPPGPVRPGGRDPLPHGVRHPAGRPEG